MIIPLVKGKGERRESGSHRGTRLLSIAGKVYCGNGMERVRTKHLGCFKNDKE